MFGVYHGSTIILKTPKPIYQNNQYNKYTFIFINMYIFTGDM